MFRRWYGPVVCLALLMPSVGRTEESLDDDGPRLSRQEWLDSVESARQRVERMRREGKSFVPVEAPIDEAVDNSRRVLRDETLRAGDVVSTDRGLMQYRGRAGDVPRPEDFIPLNDAGFQGRR